MTIEMALRYKVIIPAKIDDELVLDVTYDPDSLLKFMPWQIRLLRKLVNKLIFEKPALENGTGLPVGQMKTLSAQPVNKV